ncbi:WD domain-containing protein [Phlyctema vagabunda]|uniref:WD domain-containing protein n=1 Tax=Phlyctema vagabunda TaxID=108571 RepID=A0ABR4PAA7_9HELO
MAQEETNNRSIGDLEETSNMAETSEDDIEYEPPTEDSDEDDEQEAFLARLLAAHYEAGDDNDDDDDEENEDDDDDDPEDEDDEANPYVQYEVRIGEGEDDGTLADAERSEPQTFAIAHIIMLIFRFAVAHNRAQVMRLLQNTNIGRLFQLAAEGSDDDEDDPGFHYTSRWRRRRSTPDPDRFPKVPSDEGTELMNSGTFGSNEVFANDTISAAGMIHRKKLARRILERELAVDGEARQKVNKRLMAQGMIPSSNADMIIHYNQPVYSGQFSDDGNFFFSANKDFKVRMYDTSNPYQWRYYKTVEYPFGQWTLTDASLSPDNKYLAYTSIRSTVCLAPTDPNDLGDPYILDLADRGGNPHAANARRSFGIWSIRFSGDGRNLVAGATGGSIVVYDIESRTPTATISGHDDDVNAVCFADSSSPHILYSGSDDKTLKVWDTRSMGDSREAGAFVGHIEGLTYIDSKGDGRYILSNGKDQSMKLWDLRMVMSPSAFGNMRPTRRPDTHFDYRWGSYDDNDWYKHDNDNSLVTFRGHRVLRTLIRCHFSPPGSTNSRYVYSGSEDGKVYVWNMDATLAGKIDVYAATKNTRPASDFMHEYDDEEGHHTRWKTCVRDASWHPNAPIVVASAWSGYGMSTGTCTVHSWNDGAEEDEAEPEMGLRVNQKLQHDPHLYEDDNRAPTHPLIRRRFI